MTPKQKAKELVDRYLNIEDTLGPNKRGLLFLEEAKQCALICVDEMLGIYDIEGDLRGLEKEMAYLEEVKKEINKL